MLHIIVDSLAQLCVAGLSYLLGRWLFDLSSPEQDWYLLRTHRIWSFISRSLRWYNGTEFIHQVRAYKLLYW